MEAIEASLRKSGYIGLIIFLSVGLLIGVLYLLFSAEVRNLESQREQYAHQIDGDKQIEGYFRSIQERTGIVSNTMSSKRPWAELLSELTSVVAPPVLADIAVDDSGKITITVNASSVDALVPIVNGLIAADQAKQFIDPQLISFQFAKSGSVVATFSFSAVF